MRILLCALNASYVHTSLALRYLEATAPPTAHHIETREFTINDRLDLIEGEIERQAPDLLAFSCYIWNIAQVLEIADSLKKSAPDRLILLGGPEVSYNAGEILAGNPVVDFIIAGEGELPWSRLLSVLPDGSLETVPGLYWRDGHAIRSNAPPEPPALDELPSPYTGDCRGLSGRLAYLESSRGCPFSCSFCLSGGESGVRFADPARILAEVEHLAGSGAAVVKFVDRSFNGNRDHAMAVWRGLLPYTGRLKFHFEIVGDLLAEEQLAFLATVPDGLFQFEIGVQSTNPETLSAVGRRVDQGRLAGNLRSLLAAGNIDLHLDFIAGLPYEGFDRFLESLDFGLDLRPREIQLGFLKLLHGSGLRAAAADLGYAYRRRPPYEVLRNPWLAFADLTVLKVMAHLIDSYYNDFRFSASLPRLYRSFSSPARFFASFANYSLAGDWHTRAHQARDLPEHLLGFAGAHGLDSRTFRDRLRFDLYHLGVRETPAWAEAPEPPDLQSQWHTWLSSRDNRRSLGAGLGELSPREIARRTRIAVFRQDPAAPPEEESPGSSVMALVYPDKKAGGGRVRAIKLDPSEFAL